MNEQFNQLEEAIRERLDRSASDVPEVGAMRKRVLAALEMQDTVRPAPTSSFWTRGRRTAGLLVGVAAAITAAAVVLPGQARHIVVAADESSSEEAETSAVHSAVPRIDLSAVGDALGLPTEATGGWAVRAEAENVLTLEFVPDAAEPVSSSQYLRIITLPSATTSAEVVDSITSSLFDTTVISDSASRIGGLDSRAIRLSTVEGTTHLGFKVADDMYLETGGTDRSFVVHVVASGSATSVFWIEASPEQIVEFEETASRLVGELVED